jgi:hypothetical protein
VAADDFAHLEKKLLEYVNVSGQAVYNNIDYLLYLILKECRNYALYGSTDSFLRYFNDFEASTYAGSNYLADTATNHPWISSDNATEQRYDMLTVLTSLAITFNARVFQADGKYWFMPMNIYQRKIDGDTVGSDPTLFGILANGTDETISVSDKLAFSSGMSITASNTNFAKLAGGTITYQAPLKKVLRTRTYRGNELIASVYDNDETNFGSALHNFADADITYFANQTFVAQVNTSLSINANGSATTSPGNLYFLRMELTFKVGTQYWTNSGWSSSAGVYNVTIDSFQANVGTSGGQGQTFIEIDELPSNQVGLDASVRYRVIQNLSGVDLTSSVTCPIMFSTLNITYGDIGAGPGDSVTYTATTSLDNQVEYNQEEVVMGPIQVDWFNGVFDSGEDFVSSQTATAYPIHRLGVREILANQQLPAQVKRGSFYSRNTYYYVWPYNLIVEGSDTFGIFELEYSANRREYSIERWRFNADFTNITMPTETVNSNNPQADYGLVTGGENRLIQQVLDVTDGSQPIYHVVRLIEHDNTTQYDIDIDDSNGYMYMNTWIGTGTGFGRIILPKVADNEGRMFRFKTDSTIGANAYYRVQLSASEIANGVTIDGASYAQMDRPYDGIAVLCYDGNWYVIQRKSK